MITGTGFHGESRLEVRASAEACGARYAGAQSHVRVCKCMKPLLEGRRQNRSRGAAPLWQIPTLWQCVRLYGNVSAQFAARATCYAGQDGGEFRTAGDLQKGITTHLVVKEAKKEQNSPSLKFLRAVEWGIPVTRWGWLRACAEARAVLPVQPHHLIPQGDRSRCQASYPSEGLQQDASKEPLRRFRSSSSADAESHHSQSDLDNSLPAHQLHRSDDIALPHEDGSSSDQTCSLPSSPNSSADLSPARQEITPRCTMADQIAVPDQHPTSAAQSHPQSGTGSIMYENGPTAAAEARQAHKALGDSSHITKRRGPLPSRDTSAANSSSSEDDVEFAQRPLGYSHFSLIRPNL